MRVQRSKGIVKWFNDAKGFGFIMQKEGPDVFVHHTAITKCPSYFRSLEEGQQVTFILSTGPHGSQAQDVKVVGGKVPEAAATYTTPKKLCCPHCGKAI